MKKLKSYSSKISSNLGNISREVENIISYLKDTYGPLNEDTVFEIKVVLNELVINAIKHGNEGDSGKYVTVEVCVDAGYAVVMLEDEGKGYDYRCVKNSDVCGLNETGRGMQIVASLCESIKMNETGNRIVITKKLNKKDF